MTSTPSHFPHVAFTLSSSLPILLYFSLLLLVLFPLILSPQIIYFLSLIWNRSVCCSLTASLLAPTWWLAVFSRHTVSTIWHAAEHQSQGADRAQRNSLGHAVKPDEIQYDLLRSKSEKADFKIKYCITRWGKEANEVCSLRIKGHIFSYFTITLIFLRSCKWKMVSLWLIQEDRQKIRIIWLLQLGKKLRWVILWSNLSGW